MEFSWSFFIICDKISKRYQGFRKMRKDSSFNQEVYIKQNLCQQLTLFRRGWLGQSGCKFLLHDKDEYNLFPQPAIWDIRNKCKYISKAINTALDCYDEYWWTSYCEKAVDKVNNFEKVTMWTFLMKITTTSIHTSYLHKY